MDIFDRIDYLVITNGITGTKLCRDLGLSNSLYSQWRARIQRPSNRNLYLVAQYFNVPVSFLITGDGRIPLLANANNEVYDTSGTFSNDVYSDLMKLISEHDKILYDGEILSSEATQYLHLTLEAAHEQIKRMQERTKSTDPDP